MANSMPFNSINADRPYKAEDWAWYFGTFIGNGVFPKPETGLQVVANEGMKITVNEGKAFINGYAFKNPSNYEITLDTADGALARIDRVVVRWDLVNRDMYIDVLKGTVSSSPKAVDVTRNSEIYELALADVTVSKGVTSITQAYITDQRFNTALCGIVKGTVEEIDTSVIIAQFEDFVKTYQDEQLAEFEQWVESIKDVLDENAAGNLQLQIDENKLEAENQLTELANETQGAIDVLKDTIGYSKKNLIPYPHHESTQTDNGVTWTDNGDGTVNGNGTSTAQNSYTIRPRKNNPLLLKKGKYILSGGASGGSASTYSLVVLKTNSTDTGYDILANDFGDGAEFELTEDTEVGVMILAWTSGVELNNLVFKPMIRYASIEDDTYEPYVPSVNEPQVFALKTGLSLIIQGKLAILKCEGYSYTHNETIISDDKYKPNGQIYRNMMRAYTSDAKYYDGLVSVKNDGTITMSYLSSQGTGPSTNNVASGQLYGELIYLIK